MVVISITQKLGSDIILLDHQALRAELWTLLYVTAVCDILGYALLDGSAMEEQDPIPYFKLCFFHLC